MPREANIKHQVTRANDMSSCRGKVLFSQNDPHKQQNYNASVSNDNDTIPVFDVNKSCCSDKFKLALLVKDGWRNHSDWLEQKCSDFKAWKSQSYYQLGFVLLA